MRQQKVASVPRDRKLINHLIAQNGKMCLFLSIWEATATNIKIRNPIRWWCRQPKQSQSQTTEIERLPLATHQKALIIIAATHHLNLMVACLFIKVEIQIITGLRLDTPLQRVKRSTNSFWLVICLPIVKLKMTHGIVKTSDSKPPLCGFCLILKYIH